MRASIPTCCHGRQGRVTRARRPAPLAALESSIIRPKLPTATPSRALEIHGGCHAISASPTTNGYASIIQISSLVNTLLLLLASFRATSRIFSQTAGGCPVGRSISRRSTTQGIRALAPDRSSSSPAFPLCGAVGLAEIAHTAVRI